MRFLFLFILLFVSNLFSITYTPNDDINTSEREFIPTLDCYYQKKENISQYGYTLQCYDVADNPTSKHYIVTKDLNNTAFSTDSNGNDISSVTADNNWYIGLTDSSIYDSNYNNIYSPNLNYFNDSSKFDQSLLGSYSTDVGTMYYAKSGVFDKAIAHNTANNYQTNLQIASLNVRNFKFRHFIKLHFAATLHA